MLSSRVGKRIPNGAAQPFSPTVLAGLFCLAVFVLPVDGDEIGSVNRDKLNQFRAAVESDDRPVTVVSFGDSMADSYRSPTFHLMNKLTARFGSAGFSLANYRNTALYRLAGGAAQLPNGPFWFSYYFDVPAGGSVWWDNQVSPGGAYCDSAGIFYVTQPEGGLLKLLVSTNGGPWTTKLTLDGHSESPTGHFTNVVLSADNYRLRVDSEAGMNYVIGPHTLKTRSGGVHAVFMDWPGIHLGQITNVPLAIREPIFAGLQPDLLVWHMKEDGASSTGARMEENECWWRHSAPDCDVLYIGTTWLSTDVDSTTTQDQNRIVRQVALNHSRAYTDLTQPTTSYAWLQSSGFMADETHLNSAGGLFCANIIWDDVGFFALGLDRELSVSTDASEIWLNYTISPGAVYQLESSADLRNWTPVVTNAVGSATFSTNLTSAIPPVFFRLGLSPE